MRLTHKQAEYIAYANHRWNFKCGATGSGKSFLDSVYIIPQRILERKGKPGLNIIMGVTKETIERNVLEPMRNYYGSAVSQINSRNIATICGEKVYCLGAEKIGQLSKIQGATFKYLYGDEVAKWNVDVFNFAKSRLRSEWSCFDGTLNPESPTHFLYSFLFESPELDIYNQHYDIDDNPYYPEREKEELKKEYFGTVWYDRLIKGLWVQAEGLIYQQFADNKKKYVIKLDKESLKDVMFVSIGVDFGGNRSLTTFVASAIHTDFKKVTVISDYNIKGTKGTIDADRVCTELIGFVQRLKTLYPFLYIKYIWADNEAQYLINSLRKAVKAAGLGMTVEDAKKRRITDRIISANTLLNTQRMFIGEGCNLIIGGLESAVWDSKKPDERLDNFSTDIDIMDAFEYSWEPFLSRLRPNMKAS